MGLDDKVKLSYANACKELKARFQCDRYTAKSELESCKQKLNEPFDSLAFRIKKLVNQIHPEFSAQNRHKLSFDKFIDAITKDLAREVIKDSAVVSIDDAIKKCNHLKSLDSAYACDIQTVSSELTVKEDLNSMLEKKLGHL
ncbi:hypothetical protein RF11_02978 [Thelohanellus kitauei]|uniref:Uncharacterized protein n=1 Tax=Thelohanellus kitauei TaxID=669202 RepID=A0A0C2JQ78_THEKT|nr:hypothetical protein RF11_02978 [Thelohanellus kitauei]